MDDISNLRQLQSLFASLVDSFAKMTDKQRNAFWKLGAVLLNQAYKGTLFDQELKLHDESSEEDNIDTLLETAEKLYILRPVIRSTTMDPLIVEIRKHCKIILDQVLDVFFPRNG